MVSTRHTSIAISLIRNISVAYAINTNEESTVYGGSGTCEVTT